MTVRYINFCVNLDERKDGKPTVATTPEKPMWHACMQNPVGNDYL